MRFLILTQYFPPEVGAPQIRLMAMARELQRLGHGVEVVTAMPNYPRGEIFPGYRGKRFIRESVDGVPVIRTWIYPATGTSVLKRLLNYWSFALTSLAGCMRADHADYIFVESPPLFLGLSAYLCSRLRRTPFVLNVSDLWPASARELGIVRIPALLWLAERLERFLYRTAQRVCAVTEGICAAIDATRSAKAKAIFLPNGVDTNMFRRVSNAQVPWCRTGEIPFLYAGTHGYAQGLDVILEAARLLRERPEIVFLLVGDGPEKSRLEQRVREERMQNVRFARPQPPSAMPELFSASRASIVPLRRTHLFRSARPSKIFPSLACETPVIYCGEGEAAELLTTEHCGLGVPPECPPALADAVMRLADDPALAGELGSRGRAFVSRTYTWERIVGGWLDQLVGSPAP